MSSSDMPLLDAWILLFLAIGAVSIYYSRHQPFPEYGSRFGWLSLGLGLVFLISRSAPRETTILAPAVVAAVFGGLAVVYGVRHMVETERDVLVAPFGGVLLCVGTMSLMTEGWAGCLLYTSPSPRDRTRSRMPSSA